MNNYQDFKEHLETIADLQGAAALMHWDQEVYMPPKGAKYRSRHLATLTGLIHDRFTDSKFGKLLEKLQAEDMDKDAAINVERTFEDYQKEIKLDTEFVKKRSRLISASYQQWVKSRVDNDWKIFQEALKPLVDLKREECERRGYEHHPYEALFDLYEPGMSLKKLDSVFEELKKGILPLVEKLNNANAEINTSFLKQRIPENKQWDFGVFILKEMGYDFDAGRQDKSPHPFTITFAPDDIRITTRVKENEFSNMLWSSIHEGGHALYEQGLPKEEFYGLPLSEAASLSIHESQSRFWENHIGRSYEFWSTYYPELRKRVPKVFQNVSLEEYYHGINTIQPNKIRTEADELHYHLHIIIRYEIERALIAGDIEVQNLRETWNQKYRDYLGVSIENDKEGILQDVHWSHGSFGYFPTYTLGSLYAAQFFAKTKSDIPQIEDELKSDEMQKVLNWLRKTIHFKGRRYKAEELCKRVSGESLTVEPFLEYVDEKFSNIYGI
jgi:carboxypeptidase Taq